MNACSHRWRIGDVPVSLPGQAFTPTPTPAHCKLCGATRTFLASLDGSPRSRGYYARARAAAREEAEIV